MQRMASLARRVAGLRRLATPSVTLGAAVDHLADRSAVLVLLLAGTAAVVPSPGLPVGLLFGGLAALMAARMALRDGAALPTLPARLAATRLSRPFLDALARRLVPLLRRIERGRPRLPTLARGPGARLACLMVMVQAVLVALPIPFGNTIPGVAIVLLALGLARGDGRYALAGHAVGIVALAVSASLVRAAWLGLTALT